MDIQDALHAPENILNGIPGGPTAKQMRNRWKCIKRALQIAEERGVTFQEAFTVAFKELLEFDRN